MIKSIATTLVALATVTASAQQAGSYVNEQLTQRAQQLAESGAKEAKAAYIKDGLYGVAKLSSDCNQALQVGKVSAYKCMGIEAVGMHLKTNTPLNRNTKTALDWLNDKEMTDRVYAQCFMHLGIRSDMQCAQAFVTAKTATNQVTSTIKANKDDLQGSVEPESKQQYNQSGSDTTAMKSAAKSVATEFREYGMSGVVSLVERCDQEKKRAKSCAYLDAGGRHIDNSASQMGIPGNPFFSKKAFDERMAARIQSSGESADKTQDTLDRIMTIMGELTTEALQAKR